MRKIEPRFYQDEIFNAVRAGFKTARAICLEAPTGSGKSVILAMIVKAFDELSKKKGISDRHVYIIVDKIHLAEQMGRHLIRWGLPHDIIAGGRAKRKGLNYHVATIQALTRRKDIPVPSLLIFDEAHHMSPSARSLAEKFPETKILGVTASPERLSGEGLAAQSDPPGIYDKLIKCPISMRRLTELGYLSDIHYYCPPFKPAEELGVSGGDYLPKDVEKMIQARGIYGDAIGHYKKICPDTKCLVFCKSVKSAENFAIQLAENGYTAVSLDGSAGKKERRKIISDFEKGAISHLVTCKLVLEGFDLPAIESVIDLAPTCSRALWRQKMGRLTRPAEGKEFGVYLDLVGGVFEHTEHGDIYEDIDWRFSGREKNKRPAQSAVAIDHYCAICYRFMTGRICQNCGAEKAKKKTAPEQEVFQGELVELTRDTYTPMSYDFKSRKVQDAITLATELATEDLQIKALELIGDGYISRKQLPLWIYRKINKKAFMADMELLHRIRRHFGYKAGWAHFAKENLKGKAV